MWRTGVVVQGDAATTEFILVNKDGVFKCRAIRMLIRNKAFNDNPCSEATSGVDEWINKGASTTPPSVDEVSYNGVPGSRTFVPRRAQLKPETFETFGSQEAAGDAHGVGTGLEPESITQMIVATALKRNWMKTIEEKQY